MRLKTFLWFPIILLALAGCGEGDEVKLEKGPFLKLDRESLGFGTEFGTGTYVGASTFNALYIENRGDEPLEITAIEKIAPGEFIVQVPTELSNGGTLKLESRGHASVQVQFKPSSAKTFEGRLSIKSNAKNAATKDITLSGRGVTPP